MCSPGRWYSRCSVGELEAKCFCKIICLHWNCTNTFFKERICHWSLRKINVRMQNVLNVILFLLHPKTCSSCTTELFFSLHLAAGTSSSIYGTNYIFINSSWVVGWWSKLSIFLLAVDDSSSAVHWQTLATGIHLMMSQKTCSLG